MPRPRTFTICPNCKTYSKQKVIQTIRNSEDNIFRRRYCCGCEHRWYTIQSPEQIIVNPTNINSRKNLYSIPSLIDFETKKDEVV